MVAVVVEVFTKVYAVEVKVEVVWEDGVFIKTLALLTRQRSTMKPVLLLRRHSEEAQSVGYIQDPLFLRSYKSFHFE